MEILIIGGIAAGASIAAKAKRENPNANVTIIEKEDYLSFGPCGLPYYIGNQFDNSSIMYARTIEETKQKGVNVLSRHKAYDIDFDEKLVYVKNLDNSQILKLSYDKLAICTGSTPSLFGEGVNSENVYTMTREDSAFRFKKEINDAENIVIVGAGFIGLEVAEQLASLGKKVKIIHRSRDILVNLFDEEISKRLVKEAEKIGIEFLFGHTYKGFKTKDNRAYAVLTDKGEIECDVAVIALGFKPNTSFIKDERLKKIKNGAIITDSTGKTSIEDVYAAGDCATVNHKFFGKEFHVALATYANKMGRIIGENIALDKNIEYIGVLGSSSIKIGEMGAAATGLNEVSCKNLGIDYKTSFVITKNQTAYVKGQEDVFIKLVYDAKTRVILGAQIMGKKGAVERITGLVVAIHKEVTVDELGFMDFPYSPPFSPTWDPLNVAGNASK